MEWDSCLGYPNKTACYIPEQQEILNILATAITCEGKFKGKSNGRKKLVFAKFWTLIRDKQFYYLRRWLSTECYGYLDQSYIKRLKSIRVLLKIISKS